MCVCVCVCVEQTISSYYYIPKVSSPFLCITRQLTRGQLPFKRYYIAKKELKLSMESLGDYVWTFRDLDDAISWLTDVWRHRYVS